MFRPILSAQALFLACLAISPLDAANPETRVARSVAKSSVPTASDTATTVDRLLLTEFERNQTPVAGLANDEDFLRRIAFDITGQPPTPQEVTLFGLNPDPKKRPAAIHQLLTSPEFGKNWSRYWRDVVFLAATNTRGRGAQFVFENWLADQLNAGQGWDAIVTEILTATGDVAENGATGLFMAHSAEPAEVAAEASRIFLGIQIQCANCHDHPSDIWKREQFHELAAYFPRVSLRPKMENGMIRGFEVVSVNERRGGQEMFRENPERAFAFLDRNRDKKISKQEAENGPGQGGPLARNFDRILQLGDTNKDNALSLEELRNLPMPNQVGRGSTEYYMSDLNDPSSRGKLVQPKFFVDQQSPGKELNDLDRRTALARSFVDPANPWFARAYVNRIWNEMLGEGFYMPVDDLGPTRNARFPEVLDILANGFVANHYDPKWLVETVALTQAYQRQVRPRDVSENALPFAAQTPTRLRSDQLFSALTTVLGFDENAGPQRGGGMMMNLYRGQQGPRAQFDQIFTFDPSTPQEDITGNIQQSLFLMNTPTFRNAISATGNSRLARILRTQSDDQDAVSELYLLVLSREPSNREVQVCQQFLRETNNRNEAFEDLFWSLLNSSEFLSRR